MINRILQYILDMAAAAAFVLPFVMLWRLMKAFVRKRRGLHTTFYHEAGLILFLIFLAALASQTIIPPFDITRSGIHFSKIPGFSWDRVNLFPFHVLADLYEQVIKMHSFQALWINFAGNVILFMPIGFCVPLLSRRTVSFGQTILIGFGFSLCIELCQLPLDRISDVDDLILNTLGAMLGYALLRLFGKCVPKTVQKFKIQENES